MKRILLTTSMALGALSSAAYAEPVVLTDAQMETVTAGQDYYTYRTEDPYDNPVYRRYQNQIPYYYDENEEGFLPYGDEK